MKDTDFLLELLEDMPTKPPLYLISEYIEGRRLLPPDTPFPGFWSNSFTPYSVELMDNMSPFSGVQHQAVMKCAQSGVTACAEAVIAYWMDESPAPILFISATEDSVEKWASERLEPLIDSCGFRHKMVAKSAAQKGRRTGDKAFSKSYIGGSLHMTSARKPVGLRSQTKRVLIRDEIDGAPEQLVTKEGSWLKVSLARTNAFQHRRRVFDLSTPTVSGESPIYEAYLIGDRRASMIPCPICGKLQPLEFTAEDGSPNHGLFPDKKAGELERVYYLCQFCHDAFFQDSNFLQPQNGARWEPMAQSIAKSYRSYHLGGLVVPFAMMSWRQIWEEYEEAQAIPGGMRAFLNLILGLPYVETGARPKVENVIELRGGYSAGEVQDDVLFLTCGVDVQRGGKNSKARVEFEVCGHGLGYRTWSMDYQSFEGSVSNAYEGAWERLYQYLLTTEFKRSDGAAFPIQFMLVDSGDGATTDVVYEFCSRLRNCFPSKGTADLTKKKREAKDIDEQTPQNFVYYKFTKPRGGDLFLYTISTNRYKRRLYDFLALQRKQTGKQPPGFCDFPREYGKRFFEMLTAEEQLSDGSFASRGRRNEALDCRVLNMCGAHIYLDNLVEGFKNYYKDQGESKDYIDSINTRYVLDYLAAQTARKDIKAEEKVTPEQPASKPTGEEGGTDAQKIGQIKTDKR